MLDRPYSIVVGDFNKDEYLDIAVACYGDKKVVVRLGDGDGTFSFKNDLVVACQNDDNVVIHINQYQYGNDGGGYPYSVGGWYGGGYGLYGPTSWRNPVSDLLAGYGIASYPSGTPYYPYGMYGYGGGYGFYGMYGYGGGIW
jgi:hypothetical protein